MFGFEYNYLLFIEYDGTNYSGWQKQLKCKTVQAEVEKAAQKIFGNKLYVMGASRTDKGVHALMQAANLLVNKKMKPDSLKAALNAWLPKDVLVYKVKAVSKDFLARYKAKYKIYNYYIWNHRFRSVWDKNYCWYVPEYLNIELMKTAAKDLLGEHDFRAFAGSRGRQANKVVNLQQADISRKNGKIVFTFKANRFLYHMVRNIAGTLAGIGAGRIKAEDIKKILKSKDRTLAGKKAPAHGLFLKKIFF